MATSAPRRPPRPRRGAAGRGRGNMPGLMPSTFVAWSRTISRFDYCFDALTVLARASQRMASPTLAFESSIGDDEAWLASQESIEWADESDDGASDEAEEEDAGAPRRSSA